MPKYSANILWWNFEAWECMMQGVQLFRHFTKDDNSKARVQFRKALDLDPNYAMGSCGSPGLIGPMRGFTGLMRPTTRSLTLVKAFAPSVVVQDAAVKAAAPYCPWSWPLSRRSTVAAMSGMSLTR